MGAVFAGRPRGARAGVGARGRASEFAGGPRSSRAGLGVRGRASEFAGRHPARGPCRNRALHPRPRAARGPAKTPKSSRPRRLHQADERAWEGHQRRNLGVRGRPPECAGRHPARWPCRNRALHPSPPAARRPAKTPRAPDPRAAPGRRAPRKATSDATWVFAGEPRSPRASLGVRRRASEFAGRHRARGPCRNRVLNPGPPAARGPAKTPEAPDPESCTRPTSELRMATSDATCLFAGRPRSSRPSLGMREPPSGARALQDPRTRSGPADRTTTRTCTMERCPGAAPGRTTAGFGFRPGGTTVRSVRGTGSRVRSGARPIDAPESRCP